MNLEEKLKKQQYKEIWQQYCGFLDLSMNGYMKIQRRLMEEQVKLWSNCGLGQSILKGKHPQNLDEFRKMVPLTTYDDYADILLAKQPDMLPGNPVIWIQTTWEGGKHPIKVAPYTRSMLDTYRNNVTACLRNLLPWHDQPSCSTRVYYRNIHVLHCGLLQAFHVHCNS